MLAYAFLHLKRSIRQSCITALSFLTALCLILSIQQSMHSRQQNLDSMAAAMDIPGTLANATGNATQNLQFDKYFAQLFLDDQFPLSSLVKDVRVLAVNTGIAAEEESVQVKGVTRPDADNALSQNSGISYNEGFDDSIFMSHLPVCVISRELTELTYPGEDGSTCIDLKVSFRRDYYRDYVQLPITLEVIGICMTPGAVYMPLPTLMDLSRQEKNVTFRISSLSFTIRDNKQLDAFRDLADNTFIDADLTDSSGEKLSLLLKDTQYLKLIREAEKNLAVMQLLQPVLYLCAIGAGMMLVTLQMRARKKEMAVIRSLGAGKGRVLLQCLLEYGMICFPTTLLFTALWQQLKLTDGLTVCLFFMAGVLLSVIGCIRTPLAKQIRELEE